ncbi:MAG TPA: L,D-transpeptidase [Solirubrobacteraceae bacterium]|nr:L,D-transpeptidase [Solirubrobacteraceae bacterium]
MRELGFFHAKFVGRIGALLCALVAVGGTALGASPVGPAAHGPTRAWGGTQIRSLDPARISDATSESAGGRDQVLSNETTFTRWAYVDQIGWIHRAPAVSSPRLGRLAWYTPDGFSSIYLVLRAYWDGNAQEWVELRIPGRPNGRTGWVQRGALGAFHLTHQLLVVNRERLRMYFYSGGRKIWSAPVGVGKPNTPTPTGHFWIDERFEITDPSSGYYPYAFGTTDYSTLTDWPGGGVVGIHGPYYDAQGIPGYISHGCIRLEVSDDFWLAEHLKLGTPVRVI